MSGLIEKDLRLTVARKQTLLIFFVVALIMGMSVDGSFIIGYLTMLAIMVAIGTISYDEYDNGFAFLLTLPFGRKTYVKEKYLFSFLIGAAAWILGVVVYVIGNLIHRTPVNLAVELPMLLTLIPVMYLTAAIMIPLQLKYGSERSRFVLFLIFGIIAIVLFGSKRYFSGEESFVLNLVRSLEGKSPMAILLVVTGVCAAAVIISYLFSARVLEKKEF